MNPHHISLMLSSIHPHSDLCALQQGQATEELLLSASWLAGLQCWGEQTGTWTRVPGNQHLDLAQPITWLHVALSKSPINWSDCPVDWKRVLWVSVWYVSEFPSVNSLPLPVTCFGKFNIYVVAFVYDIILTTLENLTQWTFASLHFQNVQKNELVDLLKFSVNYFWPYGYTYINRLLKL